MKMLFIVFLVLGLFACGTIQVPPADAGMIALSWEAPTTNEDGTALTDLSGYKLYCGIKTGIYDVYSIDVGNVLTYTIKPVNDGTYFCVATAYNKAKTESAYSNEVSKIVVNKPNKPVVK
jgi:hypothetical protein